MDAEPFTLEAKAETPAVVTAPAYGTLDLRRADCMDMMAEFPDGYFDLAIVDPPYGINAAKKHTGSGWVVRETKDWDKEGPTADYFAELYRISQNQIIWGANYYPMHLPKSMGWIFWDKGQRSFSLADGELAFSSFNRALRVFEFARGKMLSESDRFHPTQKPVALYKWMLANYAKPGQRILDTHLGSGSHAIACYYAGMHLTACEIDEDYFKAASERIERETAQTVLF
jgi:site-specific DNA-methyltransferase (adenine-specific)